MPSRTDEPAGHDVVRFSAEYTIGQDFPRRLMLTRLRRADITVRLVTSSAVLFLGIAISSNTGTGWPILIAGILVIAYLAPWIAIYYSLLRERRRQYPVGSTIEVRLTDRTITVVHATIDAEHAYVAFDRCVRQNSLVTLRDRITWAGTVLPEELFTDESYAFLLGRIQPSKAAAAAAKPAE